MIVTVLCSFLSQLFSSSLVIVFYPVSTFLTSSSIYPSQPFSVESHIHKQHSLHIFLLFLVCSQHVFTGRGTALPRLSPAWGRKTAKHSVIFVSRSTGGKAFLFIYWFIWQGITEHLLHANCYVTNGCKVSSQTLPRQPSASSWRLIHVSISQRENWDKIQRGDIPSLEFRLISATLCSRIVSKEPPITI